MFHMNDGSTVIGNILFFNVENGVPDLASEVENVDVDEESFDLHTFFMEKGYKLGVFNYYKMLENLSDAVLDKYETLLLQDAVKKTKQGTNNFYGGLVISLNNISSFSIVSRALFVDTAGI